ncbi:uncharacterized protein LAESUDRAFT_730638 [Laetiporus sulphureus 93-53]|uniref:SURP motif domain-containing protein n=1 Tax=Laetiporus sulphureus 93-53 TaxID=1314785 RepID=A0A165BZQ0_9APHY|nr:uncharacterized protein LAESUDRAFT_730638 [Laetiporus sulphureus 93-53]KZT01941.1 hypothetical protein LAESUDRAFT_730638 [Laetiporus sulphureus 93-53]
MYAKSRKRKYRSHNIRHQGEISEDAEGTTFPTKDPALYIQAHEADVVRGPQAAAAATSLEVDYYEEDGKQRMRVGGGLIKWKSGETEPAPFDEDHAQLRNYALKSDSKNVEEENGLWVDRYDARLLLDHLRLVPSQASVNEPDSPGSWSDLPSDTEDTFFFDAQEVEDYRRDKRRRLIERNREERLNALRSEGGEDHEAGADEERWGGSDEEPDDTQRQLMRRTAAHILSSPNPAQLEMRILANHGADRRFAFLRGRWSRAWEVIKGRARLDSEQEKQRAEQAQSSVALPGLGGYGDSDDEADAESHSGTTSVDEPREQIARRNEGDHQAARIAGQPESAHEETQSADLTELQRARRARAKQWAEERQRAANG